jgi:hypothetical protein
MFPLAHTTVTSGGRIAPNPEGSGDANRAPHRRAPRAAGILRLVRDFLLLEDDYEVGWEAEYAKEDQAPGLRRDGDMTAAVRCPGAHMPSRRRPRRRAGQPAARPQVCVSPLVRPAPPRLPVCRPDDRLSGHRG